MRPLELPLFPLPAVLYPSTPIPLHVFERRYRQMLAQVLAGDRRFGIVAVSGPLGPAAGAGYRPVGCVAEVRNARRYPDGRLDLVCLGGARFRVEAVRRAAPFIIAEVAALDEAAGPGATELVARTGALFGRYLDLLDDLGAEPEDRTGAPADPVAASYLIAAALRIDLADKQRLLELPDAASRLGAERRLLHRELALLDRYRAVGPARMRGPFSLN